MSNKIDKVQLSFLDSDSKAILNKINEKLDGLDQKLSFVTEFLIKTYSPDTDEDDDGVLEGESLRPLNMTSAATVIGHKTAHKALVGSGSNSSVNGVTTTHNERPSVLTQNPTAIVAPHAKRPRLHDQSSSLVGSLVALQQQCASSSVGAATTFSATSADKTAALCETMPQTAEDEHAGSMHQMAIAGVCNRRKQAPLTIMRMGPTGDTAVTTHSQDVMTSQAIITAGIQQPHFVARIQSASDTAAIIDNLRRHQAAAACSYGQQTTSQPNNADVRLYDRADCLLRLASSATSAAPLQPNAADIQALLMLKPTPTLEEDSAGQSGGIKSELVTIDSSDGADSVAAVTRPGTAADLMMQWSTPVSTPAANDKDSHMTNGKDRVPFTMPAVSSGVFESLTSTLAWAKEQQFWRQAAGMEPDKRNGNNTLRVQPPPPAAEELSPSERSFPEGALQRAADKAARSFESTQPKVFAWQMMRETIRDEELKNVHITLRTFSGESADDLVNRQLPKIQGVVRATMDYFKCNELPKLERLSKAKVILSHLKNNTKVRNWTLREGRPTKSPNNPEVLWRRYAAYMGPGGLQAAGFPLPNEMSPPAPDEPFRDASEPVKQQTM